MFPDSGAKLTGMLRRHLHAPARHLGHLGLLFALTLCAAGAAQAQWKWRDAQGHVQYSDRAPPASVPDRDVLQRPAGQRGALVLLPMGAPNPLAGAAQAAPAAASDAASAPRRKPGEADDPKRRAEEAQQRLRNEEAAQKQRADNCAQAKDQIRLIQDGVRLARINAQGEREILDDAQRNRELERARTAQASECR
jgi:hypothetical protein